MATRSTLLKKLKLSPDFASSSSKALGRLGSEGKHPSSCKRDLLAFLGDPKFPEPAFERVPVAVAKPKSGETVASVDLPVLDPHTYFAWLCENQRDVFAQQFLGDDRSGSLLNSFWSGVVEPKDPRLVGHDFKDKPIWKAQACPCSFHGDAVPCLSIGKASSKSFDAPLLRSSARLGHDPRAE
eukprot:13823063-Alexandrium_andersonii.AAC.1